jgi:hypothetical protein
MRKIVSNQFPVLFEQFFHPFSRILEKNGLIYKKKGTLIFSKEKGQTRSFSNGWIRSDSPLKESLSPFK